MTNKNWSEIDPVTGRIVATASGTEAASVGKITAREDTELVEHAVPVDPLYHYVDVGASPREFAFRPDMSASCNKLEIDADGEDAATITGESGAQIYVDGVLQEEAAFPFAFTAEEAGSYRITLKKFPARDVIFNITAN